jgi:hypothetical protein
MRIILTPKKILLAALLLILINLLILDYVFYQHFNKNTDEITSPTAQGSNCPNCYTKIINLETKVTGLMQKLNISITPTISPTPIVIYSSPKIAQTVNTAKEYYVPFGAGSGSYSDWTDVPGLQAYIDSNSYGTISSVKFEASAHIPTGNEVISVRLVNATDGRVIDGSQLDFNGNIDSILLSSSKINLDYGEKLYKVQLKTQLGYPAVLDQSRIHIVTK